MAEDNVQLKREEIVGSDVNLENIYPVTDTSSVKDLNSGVSLAVIIDRILSAINNKLTRTVNSVNGKSGVVIINADDVGLGKVDNVSYDTILTNITNKIAAAFNKHHIIVAENYSAIEEILIANDRTLSGTAFCINNGPSGYPSCIGYIEYDTSSEQLVIGGRIGINSVNSTDDSLVYDVTNGSLRVKIDDSEDALYVVEGGGLKIDKSKIRSNILFIDSPYGNISYERNSSDPDRYHIKSLGDGGLDTNGIIYQDSSESGVDDTKRCIIYIDDVKYPITENGYYYMKNTNLNVNEQIICMFSSLYREGSSYDKSVDKDLLCKAPGIGYVESIEDTTEGIKLITTWTIRFKTIRETLGWGLRYAANHTNSGVTENNPDGGHDGLDLEVKLAGGELSDASGGSTDTNNSSGLNIGRCGYDDYKTTDPTDFTGDPLEFFGASGKSNMTRSGMFVSTNSSLYISSNKESKPFMDIDDSKTYRFNKDGHKIPRGSKQFWNWCDDYKSEENPLGETDWESETPKTQYPESNDNLRNDITNLAVSFYRQKGIVEVDGVSKFSVKNNSGLRLIGTDYTERNDDWKSEFFGMNDHLDTDGVARDDLDCVGTNNSYVPIPGIAVNVGRFLEIDPGIGYPDGIKNYYKSGKVNVRRGDGLDVQYTYSDASHVSSWETLNREIYHLYLKEEVDVYTHIPLLPKNDFDEDNPNGWISTNTVPRDFEEFFSSYYHKEEDTDHPGEYKLVAYSEDDTPPVDGDIIWYMGLPTYEAHKYYRRTDTNRLSLKLGKGLRFIANREWEFQRDVEADVVCDWEENEINQTQIRSYYTNQILKRNGILYLVLEDLPIAHPKTFDAILHSTDPVYLKEIGRSSVRKYPSRPFKEWPGVNPMESFEIPYGWDVVVTDENDPDVKIVYSNKDADGQDVVVEATGDITDYIDNTNGPLKQSWLSASDIYGTISDSMDYDSRDGETEKGIGTRFETGDLVLADRKIYLVKEGFTVEASNIDIRNDIYVYEDNIVLLDSHLAQNSTEPTGRVVEWGKEIEFFKNDIIVFPYESSGVTEYAMYLCISKFKPDPWKYEHDDIAEYAAHLKTISLKLNAFSMPS